MEFNIGDRVRLVDYNDLPECIRTKGMARMCGKDGEVVDKLCGALQRIAPCIKCILTDVVNHRALTSPKRL